MKLIMSLLINVEVDPNRITATVGLLTEDWEQSYRAVISVDPDWDFELVECVDMATGLPAPEAERDVLRTCEDSQWLRERFRAEIDGYAMSCVA